MKNRKGFTLIELLAVIVILAIIAIIAVPTILGVIDRARKGAAESSALGYIDAVEKQTAINLLDSDATNDITEGAYTISELDAKNVQVKGSAPSDGWVQVNSKGEVVGYSLKVGDYYVNPENNDANKALADKSGELVSKPEGGSSTPASCPGPGCKFVYTTNKLTIGTSEIPSEATDDYTTLAEHPYFLGLIANETTGKIERLFACGVENGTPFCLEGKDKTKYADPNVGILNTIFPSCNASASNYDASCHGSSVNAIAINYGFVGVRDDDGECSVNSSGKASCDE